MQSVVAALGPFMAGGSSPEQVAEVVLAAATDESDRLRYAAGADAERILATRADLDDAMFFAGIRGQFGLP